MGPVPVDDEAAVNEPAAGEVGASSNNDSPRPARDASDWEIEDLVSPLRSSGMP